MAIRISLQQASETLLASLVLAKSAQSLPVEWLSHARTVFTLSAKTYTPALGTLLLAKATDATVDALSIKAAGERAYSMRTIGHSVLVPAAREHGFSLRVTGREPLNNQPWFRYDRIDEFERVKDRAGYEFFLDIAKAAENLDSAGAKLALAAFLRVALEVAGVRRRIAVDASGLTPAALAIAVGDFLRPDAADRPQRLQALAAACMDLLYDEVLTRRLNDPSRKFPGDVQGLLGESVLVSMEVRAKAVTAVELERFVDACQEVGIGRAILLVDAPDHESLAQSGTVANFDVNRRNLATIFESGVQLVQSTLTWSNATIDETVKRLVSRILFRLKEIEVQDSVLAEWQRAVALARSF